MRAGLLRFSRCLPSLLTHRSCVSVLFSLREFACLSARRTARYWAPIARERTPFASARARRRRRRRRCHQVPLAFVAGGAAVAYLTCPVVKVASEMPAMRTALLGGAAGAPYATLRGAPSLPDRPSTVTCPYSRLGSERSLLHATLAWGRPSCGMSNHTGRNRDCASATVALVIQVVTAVRRGSGTFRGSIA